MSKFLKEISVEEVNFATVNGGKSSSCKYWAVDQVISQALCLAGKSSSCAAAANDRAMLARYCK